MSDKWMDPETLKTVPSKNGDGYDIINKKTGATMGHGKTQRIADNTAQAMVDGDFSGRKVRRTGG